MPRIVDNHNAAHGDFLIIAHRHGSTEFAVAKQRLYQTEEDALADIPKVHGHDFFVVIVTEHLRSVIQTATIADPRVPLLPAPVLPFGKAEA